MSNPIASVLVPVRKLATSVAKPLLLLSRVQLRCFRQPNCSGNAMTTALAMAMTGTPVVTPAVASPVRCNSVSVKNVARGEHFGSSTRAITTQLTPGHSHIHNLNPSHGHGRVKVLRPELARAACTIVEGSKLPEADLSYFDKEGNVHTVKVSELTRSKKVVLFAVPGAFTPTCSTQHLPGFVAKADELRKAGVDVLACVSVNDAFVMRAWGEQMKVGESVLLLSDGLGKFTKAMGATVDLSDKPVGLGVRSRRYAMIVDDGVVKALNMEEGGAFTTSSAEDILKCLQKHKAASNVECSVGQNVMVRAPPCPPSPSPSPSFCTRFSCVMTSISIFNRR